MSNLPGNAKLQNDPALTGGFQAQRSGELELFNKQLIGQWNMMS